MQAAASGLKCVGRGTCKQGVLSDLREELEPSPDQPE
jgi:hypothetical protein